MKENKIVKIDIRLTQEEKQQIKDYAEKHNTTISELVRTALNYIMNKEQ